MTLQLLSLTHASVQQLRETLRRVTTILTRDEEAALMQELLGGVEVTESSWSEWEDTVVDFKWLYGPTSATPPRG